MPWRIASTLLLLLAPMLTSSGLAQQIAAGTSQQSLNDSYFERIGVYGGFRFRQGSFNLALPQFGGYSPGAGMTAGAATNLGPFGFELSQGSRQSYTSQSGNLLLTNGMPGYMFEGSLTPFVMGNVPVVGGFPVVSSLVPTMPAQGISTGNPAVQQALQQARTGQPALPTANVSAYGSTVARSTTKPAEPSGPGAMLTAAEASSAGRAVPSVDEARRAFQAEQADKSALARSYFERGREAEQAGKTGTARMYYQLAARDGDDALKAEVLVRLDAIQSAANANQ